MKRLIALTFIVVVLLGAIATPVRADEPLVVWITDFTATCSRGAVILEWETATEFDLIGFNVYRSKTVTGRRVKVNAVMIPFNTYPGSLIGAEYEYRVKGHKADYYWLEWVNVYGDSRWFGPVKRAR